MIIIDYSQTAIAVLLTFKNELKKNGNTTDKINLIRHVVISTIESYKQKYSEYASKIVIACDDQNYWRKDFFPFYKAHRKADREESDIDWNTIFEALNLIKQELCEFFPYYVVQVCRCEADDIIATLSVHALGRHNYITDDYDFNEDCLIISSDHDFKQLQRYPHIKQWSPLLKKYVTCSKKEISEKIVTHIVKGDAGDGIPNILSPENSIVDGIRQKPVSKKLIEEFVAKGIDACKNDSQRAAYMRNMTLVSFDKIPESYRENIMATYERVVKEKETTNKFDKQKLFMYLMEKDCKILAKEVFKF
jgi:5'-3' exonuclease